MSLTRKQFVGGLAATFGGLVLRADAFGTGTPILKFGVVSDVHLGGEGKEATPLAGMAGHHDFHSVIFNNEVFTPGHGWMPKGAELKPEDLPIDYEIDWVRLWQGAGEEISVL